MTSLLAALSTDPDLAWIIIALGILVVAVLAAVLVALAAVMRKLDVLDRDFREDLQTVFHAIGRLEGRAQEEDADRHRPH